MRLILVVLSCLLNYSLSTNNNWNYQIQPQIVRINNYESSYITNDEHFIDQVLYRYDQIQLGCECQTLTNQTKTFIYWIVNKRILHRFNNSNSLQIIITNRTVQAPKTLVTCYCLFYPENSIKIRRGYHYQLYIDFESEPSLKPVIYEIQSNFFEQRLVDFLQHHSSVVFVLLFFIIGVTCSLIIYSFFY